MPNSIFPLTYTGPVALKDVGGKGLSLIRGTQAGLPVPPGFILTVGFFTPWLDSLKTGEAWSRFREAGDKELPAACDALKQSALKLSLNPEQKRILEQALSRFDATVLFAVRSSSPEEDLDGASFAGGYETVLGVKAGELDSAVKRAFASALNYRVAAYKRDHGFAVKEPKIAVIIQEQIASDTAGVGFSLNPVTNNYDEAVINANWGLGETVVAGLASPDTYIVDKVAMKIVRQEAGAKEKALWLINTGGTVEKETSPDARLCLTNDQVLKVAELIKQVEALYSKPMDIEWAFAHDKLYLLQARPITAYVPLAEDMLTAPGSGKRLYLDITVSVQAVFKPLSVIGTSFFKRIVKYAGRRFFIRDITRDCATAIPWVGPGRLYLNISNLVKVIGKNRLTMFFYRFDALAAAAVKALDMDDYRSNTGKLKLMPVGLVLKLPRIAWRYALARYRPEYAHRLSLKQAERFIAESRRLAETESSLLILADKLAKGLIDDIILNTGALFIYSRIVRTRLIRLAGPAEEKDLAALEIALPNNLTTEMGLALARVAALLPPDRDAEAVLKGIKDRSLPEPFLTAWDEWLKRYGHRGQFEIDVAAKSYRDDPLMLVKMVLSLKPQAGSESAQDRFTRKQAEARAAYGRIMEKIKARSPRQARRFQAAYRTYHTFGGYREAHKYYAAYAIALMRGRLIEEGGRLKASGRLKAAEDIFDLTVDDITQVAGDPACDLSGQLRIHRSDREGQERVKHPPALIDSRGKILRAPAPPANNGVIQGTPVSAGTVRGRVKVFNRPDEKILKPGEILIARATDPAWTPLFVNAAAVVLEIGGLLQHGALVAREYGLPCVVGVANATGLWADGTLVEVDGATGTIRLIPENTDKIEGLKEVKN